MLSKINKEEIVRYSILIVLFEILLGIYLFTKECLNGYLTILIPMTGICVLILLYTIFLKSDILYAFISIVLIQIGTAMQVIVGKNSETKFIVIEILAFILGGVSIIIFLFVQKKFSLKKQRNLYIIGQILGYLFLIIFGATINGTKAWIKIGCISFQVTEITKILAIAALALVFSDEELSEYKKWIFSSGIILLNILGLAFVRELGTLSILLIIWFLFLFLFLEKTIYFLCTFAGTVIVGVIGFGFVSYLSILFNRGVENKITSLGTFIWNKVYHRVQLLVALDQVDPYSTGYQCITARKAISLGGWFGSSYKIGIPVAESDYAFIALILNMGFVMAVVVLLLFLYQLLKGMQIFLNTDEKVEQCFGAGLVFLMFIQSFLTILGSSNFFLLMGLPISFLSAGGSNQIVVFAIVFYLLFIGRTKEIKKVRTKICRIEN